MSGYTCGDVDIIGPPVVHEDVISSYSRCHTPEIDRPDGYVVVKCSCNVMYEC